MAANDKWNEWSLKVLEELTTLNARQDQLSRDIENLDESTNAKIDKINELLNGNGTPEKGMVVRLDRQEQNEQRRTWVVRTAIAAAIVAFVAAIVQWIKN